VSHIPYTICRSGSYYYNRRAPKHAVSAYGLFIRQSLSPDPVEAELYSRRLNEVLESFKPRSVLFSEMAEEYPPYTVTPQLEAENATKPVETKQMTNAAKLWSAEAIAQLGVKGADRNRFAVTPGIQVWLLYHLSSVIVPFVQLRFWNIVRKRPGQ
jgi:hypothetical protein